MRSAVLFLVFNRPALTARVFEAIRAARPPKLYVAADGPRLGRPAEAQRCHDTRVLATAVDWPCEVTTLFRDRNLGCKRAVASALDWFFEQEPEGIVLEDDVLPNATFFSYCDELLERYRDNPRVGHIAGSNLSVDRAVAADSYSFSRYNFIWGWASWRRAWAHYDVNLSGWPAWRDAGGLEQVGSGDAGFVRRWRSALASAHRGEADTWDYQWTFACWKAGLLSAVPTRNLVENIGFGPEATHTAKKAPRYVQDNLPEDLTFPLRHPTEVERSAAGDTEIEARVFAPPPLPLWTRAARAIARRAKGAMDWGRPRRPGVSLAVTQGNACPLCASSRVSLREFLSLEEVSRSFRQRLQVRGVPEVGTLGHWECHECGLLFFSPTIEPGPGFYEQLQRYEWYYMNDKPEYALALRSIPSTGPVLEIGAGRGVFARHVGRERYVGLDTNEGAARLAAKDGTTILHETVAQHAAKHPGTYAAVVAFQVLEHVVQPAPFLADCVGALAPGGVLVIAVPNADAPGYPQVNDVLELPPHHQTHWRKRTLEHLALILGLSVLRIDEEPVSPQHAAQWARARHLATLRRALGAPTTLLDTSPAMRALERIARVTARLSPSPGTGAAGHTVVAVYQKGLA